MTHAERVSRWTRRFVLAGATLLVVRQVGEVVGIARRTAVTLGVPGFVLHTVFGKAYALLPPYFDCDLATTRLMPVHLACSLAGTLLLAGAGGCRPSTRRHTGCQRSPGAAGRVVPGTVRGARSADDGSETH
jgi:hypothetical protein